MLHVYQHLHSTFGKKGRFDSSYNMTFNALATDNYFSKTWYEGAILKHFLGVVAALSRKIYASRVP